VTVWWTSQAHEAGALVDYWPDSGQVTFSSGQQTAHIRLDTADDRQNENLEVSPLALEWLNGIALHMEHHLPYAMTHCYLIQVIVPRKMEG